MKKITTSTGKNVFVNTNGLRIAEAFKSKDKEEFWVSLNYGHKSEKGERETQVIGSFQTLEQAENVILSLM